ncbi:MAG: P-II family nitrogen regulator [Cellvibrionales bacterium]|jgi:nitrogen regulatory protein P-II 1|nr:P-II family nitrogen regulator [Cellvibrionales bacterium]
MKMITALLHHIRVTEVVDALNDAGYHNLMLHDVKGTLKPLGEFEKTYSMEARVVISEVKLTLVCEDSDMESIVNIIRAKGSIGSDISGWVYATTIDHAWPIEG